MRYWSMPRRAVCCLTTRGFRYAAAAAGAIHRAAPECDTRPVADGRGPDLVVLSADQPLDADIRDSLHARGVPHLVVAGGADSGVVWPACPPSVGPAACGVRTCIVATGTRVAGLRGPAGAAAAASCSRRRHSRDRPRRARGGAGAGATWTARIRPPRRHARGASTSMDGASTRLGAPSGLVAAAAEWLRWNRPAQRPHEHR